MMLKNQVVDKTSNIKSYVKYHILSQIKKNNPYINFFLSGDSTHIKKCGIEIKYLGVMSSYSYWTEHLLINPVILLLSWVLDCKLIG